MASGRKGVFDQLGASGHRSEDDWTGENAEVESRRLTNRFVFVLVVCWTRGPEEVRTPQEEYDIIKSGMSETSKGSALYVGCSERQLGGLKYDAVLLLRGGIATVGQLESWIPVNRDGTGVVLEVREPGSHVRDGRCLEGYLEITQDACGHGGETYGERVRVERGDWETWLMVASERFTGKTRERSTVERVLERLNKKMRTLQKSDEELRAMLGQ
jgi:hypothetical protein